MDIHLQDILRFSDEEKPNVRVRFSMFNGTEDPKDIYLTDPDKINSEWFLYSGKKFNNFKKGMIAISLLMIDRDLWLLTTIKRIINIKEPQNNDIWTYQCYEAEEIEKYKPFFGRTYVSYHKSTQSGKYKWDTIADNLVISKIDSELYGENTFKGYKFELTFTQLENIVKTNRKDWIDALKHIQAVYLITDKTNGKQYVGSATSKDEYLLSRWKTYIMNGHGGNKKLKQLIDENGKDYVKNNFTYRILDYFSENYPSSKVIDSENYWKEVLKTREFGYNAN